MARIVVATGWNVEYAEMIDASMNLLLHSIRKYAVTE